MRNQPLDLVRQTRPINLLFPAGMTLLRLASLSNPAGLVTFSEFYLRKRTPYESLYYIRLPAHSNIPQLQNT